MEKIKTGRYFLMCLLSVLLIAASSGCTKESTSDCSAKFTIVVRAYDPDGGEITGSDGPRDVSVYVFDSEGLFSERIETTVGANVTIEAPRGDAVSVVVWADAQGGSDMFPILTRGVHRPADCSVGLVPTRSAHTVCDSPGDLFNGNMQINTKTADGIQIVPIYRRTGSMNITVRKLREHTQSADDDFSIVVHETQSRIDFDGSLSGEWSAAYTPVGAFDAQGVYSTGIFNMLPSDEGVTIDIYHGTELIRTVTICAGEPITVAAGLTTNVLIDFGASLDVQVSLTPWGELQIWKDF